MKPYQQISIAECDELLVPIPLDQFAIEQPHSYVKLGAPYGDKSPYYLRQSVLEALLQAQDALRQTRPAWTIQIFDAYRPLAVQQYMVDHTFAETVKKQGMHPERLTAAQRQQALTQVYQFWAVPNSDPKAPPPHSTGAAVDVTLVDGEGRSIDMGSAIDEMSPRSAPNYFADCPMPFHLNRQILKQAMTAAGFRQHPGEWWHFSKGDQLWAWLINQEEPDAKQIACYGRWVE